MYQISRAIINQYITDPSSYWVRRVLPMRPRCLKLTAPSSFPAPLLPYPQWPPWPMLPRLPLRKWPHIPATQSCFTIVDKFYPLPSALSRPGSRFPPTHLARAAPVQSDVRLSKGKSPFLFQLFNHEPKNNLIFQNANSLPITFSCFCHHCFWALSQVCDLASPACTSRRWPQASQAPHGNNGMEVASILFFWFLKMRSITENKTE